MEDRARGHVIVTGRVQGVFFRAATRDAALDLGLDGWVRNLPDGSVEAVFEGSRDLVERAAEWCRGGPPHAAVDRVDLTWEAPEGLSGFALRY